MLSSHDARVVAREASRDAGIPALALLLDEEAFTAWLRSHPGTDTLVSAHLQYLRYKPGVRMLATYELELEDGRRVPAHAWGTRPSDLAKMAKEAGRVRTSGAWGPGRILSSSRCLLMEPYPEDRHLTTLATFADPDAGRRLIEERMPECGGRSWTELQILSYKPERRFVGALHNGEEPLFVVRGHTRSRFSRALRAARAFRTSDGFRIPELRGFSRSRGVLLMEWMEGRVMDSSVWEGVGEGPGGEGGKDGTGGRGGTELARRVGAALAELHGQAALPLRRHAPRRESRGLGGAARGVRAVLSKRWGRRVRTVTQALRGRLDEDGSPTWRPVPLHGDFHPDQLLVHDDALVLLDLDRAALGDPASDLATFVSHMERRALEGQLSDAAVSSVEAALLEGYERAGGCLEPERYRLQKAASLLRLAPQPFRERSPAWPSLTRSLVERAEDLLTTRSGAHLISIPEEGRP